MISLIRNPKDFWTGILFAGLGVGFIAVALAGGYEFGSARKMGPGYFPIWIGGALALIGLALMRRGLATLGSPLGRIALLPLALVTGSTVLFGLLVSFAGLAPAIFALVLISAYASVYFRLATAVPLAIGLAVASVLVFVKGLGLAVPVMPHVLGY